MGKYLIEETTTPQAAAGMLLQPEDRSHVLRSFFEAAGCKMEQCYLSAIENKVYIIAESPDLESLYSIWINFCAGGAAASIKCTPLLPMSENVNLFRKAASLSYRPPGK